jgi:ankyrin repeat protein
MTVSPLSVTALSPYNHSQAGLLSANPMKNLEEIYSLFSRGEFSFSDLSTLENGIKDQFPNLKSVSSFPQLLAFLSVYSSNGGVLIFLLEQKLVEFECLDGDRKTILEQACLQSTTQIVELILRNGAVIDRPGVDSIPIVDLTIRGKNPQKSEVLELLLNPDYKASIESSLEVALEHDERAIPMLRARGAIVPSKLIHLIFNGNAEAQKQFLFLCKAAVANIIQPDQIELIENHVFRITGVRHSGHFTQSLFSFACFVRDLVTLRYLAPHIDFEFEDSEGLSPLGVTAKKGDSVVFAELLKAGAKLDSFCSFKNGLNPLHLACHYGHAQIVETILTSTVPYVEANQQEKKRKFSDVTNVTELRLETFSGGKLFPIHLASNGGHLNVLRVLLKFGARADSLTSEGFNFTPLMGASHYGHVEVVLELLNHTKNISPESLAEFVNAQDDQKSTALIIAVNQKQSKVIPILLSFGARMEIEEFCVEDDLDFLVDCALMGALHRDQVDSLTRKMQKQQSFVVVDEAEPESLLQIFTLVAISTGKEALFLKLIDRVLPFINSCRINHKSFLHVAVTSDLESIVIGLLDRGADINLPDKDGSAPIHLAARQGVANTLLILLQRGAKFDQPRKDGFYPIHIVAENGDTLSLSYLHLFGCDVNKQTNNASGLRPLHVAIEEEESDFVEELLGRNFRSGEPQTFVNFRPTSENVRKLGVGRYGVDVEATDKKGRPPLFFATELEHVSERMYKLLLNAGASVDSVNSVTKEPCIHRALLSAKVEHIKLLLPFLVNKGIKDKDGNKLIHKSIMYKRLDLLRLLLDSGANVEDRVDNDSSFTTLYYAGYYGTYEIAEELINRKKQKDPNGLVDFINLTFDDKCTENAAQTSLERGFASS